jgi:hypothetical protein
MSEFERELVKSFNVFFSEHDINGIAYRIKQHRFSAQVLDVLVDSLDTKYYLGIECKSISTDKGASTLYFTQHFSVDKSGAHQIVKIDEFLKKSGRKGYLAIELRKGSGRARIAYLIEWNEVMKRFMSNQLGFGVSELDNFSSIYRTDGKYKLDEVFTTH